MAKGYWITLYRSISDPAALAAYGKLAGPAIIANGGRFLARGEAVKAYEQGIAQRATVTEFDSVEQAIAAHNSPAYQEALKALGNACERDVRRDWTDAISPTRGGRRRKVHKTLVGDDVSLADICFAAELALFMNEHARAERLSERGLDKILHTGVRNDYPRVFAHFARLVDHENFRPDLKPYVEKLLSKAAA